MLQQLASNAHARLLVAAAKLNLVSSRITLDYHPPAAAENRDDLDNRDGRDRIDATDF